MGGGILLWAFLTSHLSRCGFLLSPLPAGSRILLWWTMFLVRHVLLVGEEEADFL
jgi:hypothetical protein